MQEELFQLYELIKNRKATLPQRARFALLLSLPELEIPAKQLLEEHVLLTEQNSSLPVMDPERLELIGHSIMMVDQEAVQMELPDQKKRLYTIRRWSWVAAASIVLIGLTTFLLRDTSTHKPLPEKTATAAIQPGKNGAILTLDNGRQIVLDSAGNGLLAKESGSEIRLQDGKLSYQDAGNETLATVYNTLSTPKGRQFSIVLPDGTRIWLNAGSVLRYPALFRTNERRVELSGEAYFEVSHNKDRPFIVEVNRKAIVKVLGTSFNVNAYTNEADLKTTLLTGKVKVNSFAGNQKDTASVILQPAKQAVITTTSSILVQDADIDKVVAWKNGLFDFEGMGIHEMMRQLERWYDIEVVYEGKLTNVTFFGKIGRNAELTYILSALKGFGLKYRLEGKQLIISQ